MTFGQRLKSLMEERNLTQRRLSAELNIAISTLNGYANDYREPDFKTLMELARFFHVSTDYLLGNTDVAGPVDISRTPGAQRLFHYYKQLDPQMQALLIDQAKILVKHTLPTAKSRQD